MSKMIVNSDRCGYCYQPILDPRFDHIACTRMSTWAQARPAIDEDKFDQEKKKELRRSLKFQWIRPLDVLSDFLQNYRQPYAWFFSHSYELSKVGVLRPLYWNGDFAAFREKDFSKYRLPDQTPLDHRGGLLTLLFDQPGGALHDLKKQARVLRLFEDYTEATGIPVLILHSSKKADSLFYNSFDPVQHGMHFPELSLDLPEFLEEPPEE